MNGESWSLIVLSPVVGIGLGAGLGFIGFVLFSLWKAPLARIRPHIVANPLAPWIAGSTMMVMGTIWWLASYRASLLINAKIQQAYFESTLSVSVSAALLVILGMMSPLVWALFHRFFQKFVFSHRPFRRNLTRGVLALGFVVLAVVAFKLGSKKADMLQRLPWVYVFPPLAALVLSVLIQRFGLLNRRIALRILALTALCHLGFAFLPVQYASLRNTINATPSLARLQLKSLISLSDVDRDGESNIYMGQDCRPFDRTGGPSAYDVPDNGIDEDCDGIDTLSAALPKLGQNFHSLKKPGKSPNIILITTDALSFDHTTPGGYQHDVTPTLAKFAANATVFTRAYAPAPTTYMSIPMLQTGLWYPELKITSGTNSGSYPFGLSSENKTMASRLKALGYDTVFVPGQRYFGKENWPGLATGFDEVDMAGTTNFAHAAIPTTNRVLTHLKEKRDKPLFIWVHYFDHHEPYFMPSGGKKFPIEEGPLGDKISKYNSEVERTDREWGRIFDYVAAQPADQNIVIFTSDHGEAFDELHLQKPHSHCIRESETHVPLIIQTALQRGTRIDGLASHLDILPTVLNLLGEKPPENMPGESLVPALVQGKSPEKEAVFVSFYDPTRLDPKSAFMQYGAQGKDFLFFHNRDDAFTSLTKVGDSLGTHPIDMPQSGEQYMLRLYAEKLFHELQDNSPALFNRQQSSK
jgi:arylsulfatase A-like enzyme